MADDEAAAAPPVERVLRVVGSVVAPTTLITALLFYFGYVSTRAQYDYFGLDVDSTGLATRDYVMRSPQFLLVPTLVLTLMGAAALALHGLLRRRIADDPAAPRRLRRIVAVGAGGLALGTAALLAYPLLSTWWAYPLAVPLVLAAGGAVTGYAVATAGWLARRAAPVTPRDSRATLLVLLWLTVAASLFWATATLAQWSGRGLAHEQASHLTRLPSVVLDTSDRIVLPAGTTIRETAITTGGDPEVVHYRYTGLRLLIQGPDAMFLVPSTWSARATTIVVPDDGVRVQFQFRNDPP